MIIKATLGLCALGLSWLALLAGVMAWSDAAPAALVPFPSQTFLSALPEDVAILDRFGHAIALQSDRPGYVGALYAAGAWIVLPAGLAGCAPGT